MTPVALRVAPAVLDHMAEDPRLSTLPLTVRAIWMHLAFAMANRPHTYGLNADPERLAEMVVCRVGEMTGAIGALLDERLLECGSDGYLRIPFLMRLLRPANGR